MSHLTSNTLWDYALASLRAEETAAAQEHLSHCAACQAQLEDIPRVHSDCPVGCRQR